jgi:hypothetical protein
MADEKKTTTKTNDDAGAKNTAPTPPEASTPPDAQAANEGSATPAEPIVLKGAPEAVDPHMLPPAPPSAAGRYKLTHGSVRIGDKFYGKGSILQLGADDGQNFVNAGVAEKLE